MADADNKPIDIDTMSDEDFMKLDPSQLQEVSTPDEPVVPENDNGGNVDDSDPAENNDTPDPDEDNKPDAEDTPAPESEPDSGKPDELTEKDEEPGKAKAGEPPVDPAKQKADDPKPDDKPVKDASKGKDEKPAKPDADPKPEAKDKDPKPAKVETDAAMDFFKKVSAPFKADGRDMQVRTPEDVIRLMQMGVNYSRRMEEMKPLRAQDQMLKTNGLNDPEKLNFLIDVAKGNKDAIKKLLKDHKIDPIDIDTSAEDKPYQANNYQSDPKDIAFNDAINDTISQPGGRELISDINKEWDDISKEALRDQPAIFQNILAQKSSGVYSKIKTELEYQRTMGFLNSVPFLQAYHQVGEAMQKAGVFGSTDQPKEVIAPLGTGPRKDAPKPKPEQPTPNVSSATQPRSVPSNDGRHNEPDYSSMSDEDFLKMAPPD